MIGRLARRRGRSAAARAYARGKRSPSATPWREARFVAVDLELTGLDPRADEIISAAAIPIDDARVVVGASHAAIIRPRRMPSAETIRIHGLRPVDLADAPPLEAVLDGLFEALTGRIMIAHPARVERAFLAAAFKARGVRVAEPVLCTATMARRVLGTEPILPGASEISLADAARACGLPADAPHTAEGDALTTAQLFIALATRLERHDAQTVNSLARLSQSRRDRAVRPRI